MTRRACRPREAAFAHSGFFARLPPSKYRDRAPTRRKITPLSVREREVGAYGLIATRAKCPGVPPRRLDLSPNAGRLNDKLQRRKCSRCLVFEFHQHRSPPLPKELDTAGNDNIRAREAAFRAAFVRSLSRRQIEFVTAAAPNPRYFVAAPHLRHFVASPCGRLTRPANSRLLILIKQRAGI